jgi:hypothetical protein
MDLLRERVMSKTMLAAFGIACMLAALVPAITALAGSANP